MIQIEEKIVALDRLAEFYTKHGDDRAAQTKKDADALKAALKPAAEETAAVPTKSSRKKK